MISIAIPTSTMADGEQLLTRCLESLWGQSYQHFEIVITDNSEDSVVEDICAYYKTGIRYYRNPVKGMAQNTNEAIRRSKGDLIKIIYMDDFLAHENSLKRIVGSFDDTWLVTACTHIRTGENYTHSIHYPEYSQDIYTGNNTIGSPSVLTIKNGLEIYFDEKMTWLLDCDYYKRLYDRYGPPTIIKDINVCIGLHDGQMTHLMGEERKQQEYQYITEKYANK